MPIDDKTLLAELAEIRKAQREDHTAVMGRIDDLSASVAALSANGCGQSWQHKAHGDALLSHAAAISDLQQSRAEGRGKGMVLAVLVSGGVAVVVGVLVGWLRKGGAP